MSYVVSARRWRPQTFEDLVGQEHVSRTLSNAIRVGRVAHAFLFTGVRGVGKTTTARILAKALNCEQGPTPTPCNVCVNCQEITVGSAIDVLEIDGASNTGVDDVREIIENVRYQAAKSRYKIYIIDEVHMLSTSAFNALLKTLEEPPAHVKFIFATTDPHKLPATVQSRCQRYDFRRIPLRLVRERLRQIVAADGVEISDRALFMLAREGEGSMRDAQSLLDQVLASTTGTVSDEDVLGALGIADRQVIANIGEAIITRDASRAVQLVAEVYTHGQDIRRLTRDVLEHLRNVAVTKVSDGDLLPDVPEEEVTVLRQQAARISNEECGRAFRVLQETDEEVARSPYPKLVLEMALIKVTALPPLIPAEELLNRIDELELRLRGARPADSGSGSPAPAKRLSRTGAGRSEAEPPVPPEPSGPPSSTAGRAGGIGRWADFMAYAVGERPALAHHLGTCTVQGVDETTIEIAAPRGFRHDYLASRENTRQVESLAQRFFERPLRLRLMEGNTPTPQRSEVVEASSPPAVDVGAAERNPVVRAAVEILGGEVSEVRPSRPRRREDR